MDLIKKEIADIISNSYSLTDPAHSLGTCKWVLKLLPNADYALQIAALAHDIERGVNSKIQSFIDNYDIHKELHAKKSADLIVKVLKKHGMDEVFIKKVQGLVLNHEVGGDFESDILKDADSISFFDDNLVLYFKEHSLDKTKFKIGYMFNRISSKAKEIIKKFDYDNKELNKIFQEIVKN